MANSQSGLNALIVYSSTNALSFSVCLLAAIVTCVLGLHKRPVYRLALYQVLAAMLFAGQSFGQIIFINYSSNPAVYQPLCEAFATIALFAAWAKLLLSMWTTFHVFCFAVFYRNLKRLEIMYVVTSLVVPAGVALVPLTTRDYGLATWWCWILASNASAHPPVGIREGFMAVEGLALWVVPSMVILTLSSVVMVTMLTAVACRVRFRKSLEADMNWEALKQLLPLAAYPVTFFFFLIPLFVNSMITPSKTDVVLGLSVMAGVVMALCGLSKGVTLLIHIIVVRKCRKRSKRDTSLRPSTHSKQKNGQGFKYGSIENECEGAVTVNHDAAEDEDSTSRTTFPLPQSSVNSK